VEVRQVGVVADMRADAEEVLVRRLDEVAADTRGMAAEVVDMEAVRMVAAVLDMMACAVVEALAEVEVEGVLAVVAVG
jgi:hypothetical protein